MGHDLMRIESWTVVVTLKRGSYAIGGFASAGAATAWMQEWNVEGSLVPTASVTSITGDLATFEAHRQRNEAEGKHWREGL